MRKTLRSLWTSFFFGREGQQSTRARRTQTLTQTRSPALPQKCSDPRQEAPGPAAPVEGPRAALPRPAARTSTPGRASPSPPRQRSDTSSPRNPFLADQWGKGPAGQHLRLRLEEIGRLGHDGRLRPELRRRCRKVQNAPPPGPGEGMTISPDRCRFPESPRTMAAPPFTAHLPTADGCHTPSVSSAMARRSDIAGARRPSGPVGREKASGGEVRGAASGNRGRKPRLSH